MVRIRRHDDPDQKLVPKTGIYVDQRGHAFKLIAGNTMPGGNLTLRVSRPIASEQRADKPPVNEIEEPAENKAEELPENEAEQPPENKAEHPPENKAKQPSEKR